ncbi:methyltransferase domain-containing protein [Actinosynnema pretiosum subsp. pretiosum]
MAAGVDVDPANAEQLAAWDGDQGVFWARWADRFDAGVGAYREGFLGAAAVERGSVVLDVGCGTGQVTRDVAGVASAGRVVGVDLSSPMLAVARERARGLSNVGFLRVDAQVHPFPEGAFDRVVSRHGAMFFGDAGAAFANLARALRPGGRVVLLSWQGVERNEWVSSFRRIFTGGREAPVSPSPAAGRLVDPDAIRELLGAAGFTGVRVRGVAEPMFFGVDVEDAAGFVEAQFGWMARDLPEEARARVPDALREDLAAHVGARGVRYGSAAWLVEAGR